MKGTRALGYLSEDRIEDAVHWIDDAGRTPGANAVVHLVAAIAHEMGGARNPQIDSLRLFNRCRSSRLPCGS
jgi:hypothetical protein